MESVVKSSQMKRAAFAGVIAVAMAVAFSPAFDREAEGQAPYRARRTPDGKPDLQGIWRVMNSANVNIQDHSAGSMGPAGHGVVVGNDLPYLPAALEKKKQNAAKWKTDDPYAKCFLPGVPRATYVGLPFQIVQTPGVVAILVEMIHDVRIIPLDGRPHLGQSLRLWMGDSRGRLEGDTLVVETTNFSDKTRAHGFFEGQEHMRLVERFTRVSPDVIDYAFTVEDPTTLARPWTAAIPMSKTDEPVLEFACHEGNEAIAGILAGERAVEKAAAGAAAEK